MGTASSVPTLKKTESFVVAARNRTTTDCQLFMTRFAMNGKEKQTMKDVKNIRRIADTYGYEAQSRQLIEEMAELTQAINKMWRVDATHCEKTDKSHIEAYKHIIEEVADVEICLEQVKWLLNIDESVLDEWKDAKISRSLKRMVVK